MLCHLLSLSSWNPTLTGVNIQSHALECMPRHSHIHRLMSRTSHLEFKMLYMQIKNHISSMYLRRWIFCGLAPCTSSTTTTTTLGGGSKCNPL